MTTSEHTDQTTNKKQNKEKIDLRAKPRLISRMPSLLALNALRHPVRKQLLRPRHLTTSGLDIIYTMGGVFLKS